MSVEQKVMDLYRESGYTFHQRLESLASLTAAVMIATEKDTAEYIADNFEVDIKVYGKGVNK